MTYQQLLQSKTFSSLPRHFQQMFNGQPFYKSPKNYHDWYEHLTACFTSYVNSLTQDPTSIAKYSKDITALERKAFQSYVAGFLQFYFFNKTPALYLQRNLVEAIFKTKLPLIPSDLQIPFNSIVLMLPKDMPQVCGMSIKRIIAVYGRKGTNNYFCSEGFAGVANEALICCCIVVLSNGAGTYVSGFTDSNGKFEITLAGNSSVFTDELICGIRETAFKFALNTVLLSQYQPELLTTDSPVSPSGSGFGDCCPSKNEILPIRWLGKDYKRSTESSPGTGSHASPQAHWRRGHWHHFRHGEKRKLLKLKWIEPVFVNP
jgi:hypothetical protein